MTNLRSSHGLYCTSKSNDTWSFVSLVLDARDKPNVRSAHKTMPSTSQARPIIKALLA